MLAHRLTIENQDYILEPGTDVDALKVEFCDAMRKGGGIVSFETSSHRPMTAIVSPGVPVMFEPIALPDGDPPYGLQDDFSSQFSLDDL